MISTIEEAGQIEIAMVGCDGAVGIHGALNFDTSWHRAVVRVSGDALRIKHEDLKWHLSQNPAFSVVVMRYLHALAAQIAQSAICFHRHKIQQRLRTWMMMMFNRARNDYLYLKQEEIAEALGYARPTISAATTVLQEQNIISYSRGHITLLDHKSLEKSTCVCYSIMERQYDQLSENVAAESSAPLRMNNENLTSQARSYIQQLDFSIKNLRNICRFNDAVFNRQNEIINNLNLKNSEIKPSAGESTENDSGNQNFIIR